VQESIACAKAVFGKQLIGIVAVWRFRRACVLRPLHHSNQSRRRVRKQGLPLAVICREFGMGEYDGGDFSAGCEVACLRSRLGGGHSRQTSISPGTGPGESS